MSNYDKLCSAKERADELWMTHPFVLFDFNFEKTDFPTVEELGIVEDPERIKDCYINTSGTE